MALLIVVGIFIVFLIGYYLLVRWVYDRE